MRDDGGNAFPHHACSYFGADGDGQGMSLRDWFAGQALVGILGARRGFLVDVGTDNAPEWAYRVADAMLAEREKRRD